YELPDAYRDWFGSFVPPGAGGDDRLAAARKNGQLLSLGYLKNEVSLLRRNLAGPERQKLDAHLEALNLIEQRMNVVPSAKCTKPDAPPRSATLTTVDGAVAKHKLMFEMAAQIMACNLTRVAALNIELSSFAGFLDLGGVNNGHDA